MRICGRIIKETCACMRRPRSPAAAQATQTNSNGIFYDLLGAKIVHCSLRAWPRSVFSSWPAYLPCCTFEKWAVHGVYQPLVACKDVKYRMVLALSSKSQSSAHHRR